MRLIFWCFVAGLLAPSTVFAQLSQPLYQVPCQKRSELVSRLRGLVSDPDHVELDILSFSIVAAPDQPGAPESAWTLTISRSGQTAEEPRVIRDATCQSVAEAAALVVSLWINEQPPERLAPAPVLMPPTAAVPAQPAAAFEVDLPRRTPKVHFGVGVLADGALQLSDNPSAGTSLELWLRSARLHMEGAIAVRWWISHTGWTPSAAFTTLTQQKNVVETPIGALVDEGPHPPPLIDVAFMFNWYFVHLGDLHIGPHAAFEVATQVAVKSLDAQTIRGAFGAAGMWEIGRAWSVVMRARLGLDDTGRLIPTAAVGVRYGFL
jgi:hypothetical protein